MVFFVLFYFTYSPDCLPVSRLYVQYCIYSSVIIILDAVLWYIFGLCFYNLYDCGSGEFNRIGFANGINLETDFS